MDEKTDLLRIALLQMDVQWQQPQTNRLHVEQVLGTAPRADLYLLPEMFTTGFAVQPQGVAEPFRDHGCDTLEWMQTMAGRLHAAVAGSVAVEEGGRYYNRFCFVYPDARCVCYDKHHLFTYGGEHTCYTPGRNRVVLDYRGVRFQLQVCYDLRFPCFVRNNADQPYDVILYVANWPQSRMNAWHTLLQARAIENQCYVAAVNRVGTDPQCVYTGGSCLVSAKGEVVAQAATAGESVVVGEADLSALRRFRHKFPVLRDADKALSW